MKVTLIKDLDFLGKRGDVLNLPTQRAEYLIRVKAAAAYKEVKPKQEKKKRKTKKDDADDNRSEELS